MLLLLTWFKEEVAGAAKGKGPQRVMLTRLLALAAHALAEVTFTNAANVLCIFKLGYILHIHVHWHMSLVIYYLGRDQAWTCWFVGRANKCYFVEALFWPKGLGSIRWLPIFISECCKFAFIFILALVYFVFRAFFFIDFFLWHTFFVTEDGTNGYIMISANGGINQQRVAVSSPVILSRCVAADIYSIFMLKASGQFSFNLMYRGYLCAVVAYKKWLFCPFFVVRTKNARLQ